MYDYPIRREDRHHSVRYVVVDKQHRLFVDNAAAADMNRVTI